MERKLFFPGTQITTLMSTNTFLVAGVARGDGTRGSLSDGYMMILQPSTMAELYRVKSRGDFEGVGRDANYNKNSDHTEQIWFTT